MHDSLFTKQLKKEVDRRRTFGIISHPDAGKTTLTEKLLLFGGAINMAGAVKARKASRHATSDWMAMERERGISITTSVMKFKHQGFEINLLDTPGHKDFSEDTYRVLTAVDSAIMVIDSAKGVEYQTTKLMEVCRMRKMPTITFVNKLDREGLNPFDILADIEKKMAIECVPLTWPIGIGQGFKGAWDLRIERLTLFSPSFGKQVVKGEIIEDLDDPRLNALVGFKAASELRADLDLIKGAGGTFDRERYLQGHQTPVFFGSAMNNFGIRELLDSFVDLAPAPKPREAMERIVSPYEETFSGMVFKIQANMNPAHRDRIAFLRICSGRFKRGMKLWHNRRGKEITMSNAIIFMAQDRLSVEEAWPGDIIGLHNHGTIKIGDTFTDKGPLKFKGIPNFTPEHFRRVVLKNPLKAKQLQKGLCQLTEEGAVQLFRPLSNNDYILGAVGILQFDVIISRLKYEYDVDALYEVTSLHTIRWISCKNKKRLEEFRKAMYGNLSLDADQNLAYMAPSVWRLNDTIEKWPFIEFHSIREQE